MFDAIADFATRDKPTSLRRVRVVIYNDQTQQEAFADTLWRKVEDAENGQSVYNWISKVRLL